MAKPKKITSDDEGKLLELKDYLKVKQKYYKRAVKHIMAILIYTELEIA